MLARIWQSPLRSLPPPGCAFWRKLICAPLPLLSKRKYTFVSCLRRFGKVRSTPFPSSGCAFSRKLRSLPCPSFRNESTACHRLLYDPVAQQAEHLPFKQGVRGSNPRWVTTSSRTAYRSRRLFYKSHLSLIPSLLLTKPNPLRWAPVWPWLQGLSGVYAAGGLHAAADCISFATAFLLPLAFYAAAPRTGWPVRGAFICRMGSVVEVP